MVVNKLENFCVKRCIRSKFADISRPDNILTQDAGLLRTAVYVVLQFF